MRTFITAALLAIIPAIALNAQQAPDAGPPGIIDRGFSPAHPASTATGAGSGISAPTELDWFPLSTGVNGEVMQMATLNDQLYAWHELPRTGPSYSETISRWNGTAWDSVLQINLGSGRGTLLTPYKNKLYFYGNTADRVIRIYGWDGTSLTDTIPARSERGSSIFTGEEFQNDLYIGGNFKNLNNVAGANNIARWDGSHWSPLGDGVDNRAQVGGRDSNNAQVWSIASYKGKLFVGGIFSHAGGNRSQYLAIWNGTAWEGPASGGPAADVVRMCVAGDVLYTCSYWIGDSWPGEIRAWDGTSWRTLPNHPMSWISDMIAYNDQLYVSGKSDGNYSIARWNGSAWETYKGFDRVPGNDSIAYSGCLVPYQGSLIVGGHFTSAGGTTLNNIARTNIISLGVPDAPAAGVAVFPNPSSGLIRVEAPMRSGATIAVLDMLGRRLLTAPVVGGGAQTIDLGGLPGGSYLLALPIDGGTTIRRITVTH